MTEGICRRVQRAPEFAAFGSPQAASRQLPFRGAFGEGARSPAAQAYPAHKKQNALSRSLRNRQRPSCTIGSSCYRYSCTLAEIIRRENSDSSDLRSGKSEFFTISHVRVLPSHGLPQWRPFGQTALPFLVAASRAQLRANGLKTFVLSPPAQCRVGPRPGITRFQMRMKL